ncbi:MAG: hypothetical protein LAQ69_32770 [Acidobacteriia bacterium]|nr:hypothetical protein [Terriglobia bacterium]
MDAAPVLSQIAALLDRHRLEAVMIGNAAAALQGTPVTKVKLEALQKESDLALRNQIRRLLVLPQEQRTHFLRKRVGFRMSCL